MAGKRQKEPHYEFNGPIGVFFTTFLLPAVVYFLYFACNKNGCLTLSPFRLPPFQLDGPLITMEAYLVVLGWFCFQAALYMFLPAKIVYGVEIHDTDRSYRLPYRVNALSALIVSLFTAVIGVSAGVIKATYIYDNFLPLASSAIVFAFSLAFFLYIKSTFNRRTNMSEGGNTGNVIYDFWIGRQLNPRTGDFDWKYFCELRPGLIGWVLVNLSMAAKQYENTGTVQPAMVLVNIFQFIYVFDALAAESAILTTLDIVHDGFGLMLAFGDLAWVPFNYSFQSRFLVDHSPNLNWVSIGMIVGINFMGYYIFRMSNLEKNNFRSNPNDPINKNVKYIKTQTGTNLIISGWWGMSRHINYFGDWLMSIAWSLPTGHGHIITYFYPIYFAVLLIHRQTRDDEKCRRKYGADWDKYVKTVPYRIVPYVY